MFGESDSGESPRVASPWEALISTPPSPKYIPKLVPEVEQGNVEYKLQLLSPSPARFARLVTQLKWRLLEGGGQAYYELGVADSGALIGLHRADLERTLETLECMAGEIGASVVVVREIEVPKGMHVRGGDKAGLFVGRRERERDRERERERERERGGEKRRWESVVVSEEESTTDEEEVGNEEGSPSPMNLDTSPRLFAMDPDPEPEATSLTLTPEEYPIDLEISSVYKPRPIRLSSSPVSSTSISSNSNSGSGSTSNSRSPKWCPKKKHQHQQFANQETADQAPGYIHGQTKQQAKALNRRLARDRRREDKRLRTLALAAQSVPNSTTSTSNTTPNATPSPEPDALRLPSPGQEDGEEILFQTPIDSRTSAQLVQGLESLHVTVDSDLDPVSTVSIPTPIPLPASLLHSPSASVSRSGSSSPTVPIIDITSPTSPTPLPTASTLANGHATGEWNGKADEEEVRLIVEALVVRKLSLDEAFLDFGGFSLI